MSEKVKSVLAAILVVFSVALAIWAGFSRHDTGTPSPFGVEFVPAILVLLAAHAVLSRVAGMRRTLLHVGRTGLVETVFILIISFFFSAYIYVVLLLGAFVRVNKTLACVVLNWSEREKPERSASISPARMLLYSMLLLAVIAVSLYFALPLLPLSSLPLHPFFYCFTC